MKKPCCRLSGEDGNAVSIIGRVMRALKKAGQKDRAIEFRDKARACPSYDAVIQLCFDFVDVE